jgi:GNAT superfamily N-acetyltransferase
VIEELESRPATAEDLPAIISLLAESMGRADDPRFEALFRWKHLDNGFGPSPMWVACDGDRIVGLRVFMRWEFERDGATVRCVRAVDTATHPDYQGRGIFRRLTLDALEPLTAEGVLFVFNTPNDQSRPGYLKMGWNEIGRAHACVRPLSARGAVVLTRSRVAASHWSEPLTAGAPVSEVLADPQFAELLAERRHAANVFTTRVDVPFIRWRYGGSLLDYRAVVDRRGIPHGVAFVRLRRRGAAREIVLAGLFTADGSGAARRSLMRQVRRSVRRRADYVLGVGQLPGCVRVPSFGPVVTTRDVAATAPRDLTSFDFTLGDLELF